MSHRAYRSIRSAMTCLAFALLFTGCGSLHDQLVGSWTFDLDRMIESDKEMAAKVKANPQMRQAMEKMLGDVGVEFTADRITLRGPDDDNKEGTYTVVNESGKTITIKVEMPKDDSSEVLSWTFLDDNHLQGEKEGDDYQLFLRRR